MDRRHISIIEACELLEGSPHNWPKVGVCIRVDRQQQVSIQGWISWISSEDICFGDQVFDVEVWTRLGRDIRISSTLDDFMLIKHGGEGVVLNGNLTAAAQCIEAFFSEVKYNKSIRKASFQLTGAPIGDLSYFILNNEALKELVLYSRERLSLELSSVLSGAIGSAQLEKVDIQYCRFENDGAFEQMLEGCLRVDVLQVMFRGASHYNAIAALLRDPANVLRELHLDFNNLNYVFTDEAMRNITTSLVGNTHLKWLYICGLHHDRVCFDCFDWLLCDTSSINRIVSSNHTLKRLDVEYFVPKLSILAEQCLLINENDDESEVIRNKILRFYFAGSFDVSPFSRMAISVLPEVMSQIAEENQPSAIYRLLKSIPELCNISDRASCEQHDSKRLKTSSMYNVQLAS